MRKLYFPATCVLTALVVGGCETKPTVQSKVCPKEDSGCRSLGGYSIPSIVLDYVVSEDSAGVVTVTANERAIPAAWVPLGYLPAMSSDDSVSYELEGGFLKSVGSIADDKSATVVAEILKIATAPTKSAPGARATTPKELAFTLDVSSPGSAGELLKKKGLCIKSDAQGIEPTGDGIVAAAVAAPGIYYPVERQWRVTIWDPDPNLPEIPKSGCGTDVMGKLIDDRTALVPSGKALARVDIDRSKWVKHEVTVTFDKGRLTKVEIKKPSQAAAFASIPADVLKTIVGIPAELVQFKIDTSGKDKALAEALKSKLEAEQAYIKALEDAKAAKAAKEAKPEEDAAAEPVVDTPTNE